MPSEITYKRQDIRVEYTPAFPDEIDIESIESCEDGSPLEFSPEQTEEIKAILRFEVDWNDVETDYMEDLDAQRADEKHEGRHDY